MPRTLTNRELNRTTLARQLLLERSDFILPYAFGQLLALQAQRANSPFIALWSRLANFEREHLAEFIHEREAVKGTMMRTTLHLMQTGDYIGSRQTMQPMLDSGAASIVKQRDAEFDEDNVLRLVRNFMQDEPRTFAEISAMLEEAEPDVDIGAMRYTARMKIPMLQVPDKKSAWCYPGRPKFTLAENWLPRPMTQVMLEKGIILRYLRAFGPASVADIQRWTGLSGLAEVVATMGKDLVTYEDENGRELIDGKIHVIADADTPAPVRFLPEFDNVLLAYDKRERVLDDTYRKKVYLPGLRVHSVFLVDGFVAGGWKAEKKRGTATLNLDAFTKISKKDRSALEEEGEKLLRFLEPKAKEFVVQ